MARPVYEYVGRFGDDSSSPRSRKTIFLYIRLHGAVTSGRLFSGFPGVATVPHDPYYGMDQQLGTDSFAGGQNVDIGQQHGTGTQIHLDGPAAAGHSRGGRRDPRGPEDGNREPGAGPTAFGYQAPPLRSVRRDRLSAPSKRPFLFTAAVFTAPFGWSERRRIRRPKIGFRLFISRLG